MKSNAVILFTRVPVPGKTKTRLYPFLNMENCCKLHEAFLKDIYEIIVQSDADIHICYTPDENLKDLKVLFPDDTSFFPQKGTDLGIRMHRGISDVLNFGYKNVLLIGSDIPLLKSCDIEKAFDILKTHDIAVSPADDGGYYLIGMKQPCESVFQIHYSTSKVFAQTIEAIKNNGKTYGIGNKLPDIDRKEDLIRLNEILQNDHTFICRHTRKLLSSLFS